MDCELEFSKENVMISFVKWAEPSNNTQICLPEEFSRRIKLIFGMFKSKSLP